MSAHLTFLSTTKLWTLTAGGIVNWPSTVNASAGGPYTVLAVKVPFDPIHQTGGSFWQLATGPNAGLYVSAHSNSLGYGSITVTLDGDPGTPGGDRPYINPLAEWRLLIKGMGGAGDDGPHYLTFVANTQIWSRTTTGIINWPSTVTALAGTGPYRVNKVVVPFDPIHETGGSFWELKEGPNVGYLVSFWSQSLGYGEASIVVSESFDRGPGATLATFYHPNAHLAGASKNYNAGGELHFTLLVDDPNIRVPLPKETHYCHVPGTRVLTRDLRWVPVETLLAGDELLAFDEERASGSRSRHWSASRVIASTLREAETVRVTMESGRVLTSTTNHPYLVKNGNRADWREAQHLHAGDRLPRYLDPWDEDESREAGWFAGLLDGEGHVEKGRRIHFSQNEGVVLERAREFMRSRGIRWTERSNASTSKVVSVDIQGCTGDQARVMGTVRPSRLLAKFLPDEFQAIDIDRVVAVETAGVQVVVNLTTSTATYISDGYASHNCIEFEETPGSGTWIEVYAGMIWDFDATETEVVFLGIDYLAMFGYVVDERFNPQKPDRPPPLGSKYTRKTITEVVTEQLTYATAQADSIVGFIQLGDIAAMTYLIDIYSTFADTLSFVVGLLDSWRAGTGKFTEIRVQKRDDGRYEVVVEDDPGVNRDALLLQYGNLAQGYRVVPFGVDWASRVNFVGRDPKGLKVRFETVNSPVDQSQWGRISGPVQFIESIDDSDLKRRALQASIDASRLGRQVGVGTKLGSYRPFEAYNLLDAVPVVIQHGAVTTQNWGNDEFGEDPAGDASGVQASYWRIIGVIWESYDDSHWLTTPLLWPKGTGSIPSEGGISAAFAGDTTIPIPTLPVETTIGKLLLAYVFVQAKSAVHSISFGSFVFDESWTALCEVQEWNSGQNIGPPGAIGLGVYYRFADAETTQPFHLAVSPGTFDRAGVYLYHLPTTMVPELVASTNGATGHPGSISIGTASSGLIFGGFAIQSLDYGSTPTIDATSGTETQNNDTENIDTVADQNGSPRRHKTPWLFLGYSATGEVIAADVSGLQAGPNSYSSIGYVGATVRIITSGGVAISSIPHIPYPANQVLTEGDNPLDTGPGDVPAPPPTDSAGYGPPTDDTPATERYTDLLSGQMYVYDPELDVWNAVANTSYYDSGYYVFDFASATTWVITHDLAHYPPLTLLLTTGELIEADVTYDSITQITVTFSEAVAGKAVLR